MTHPHLVLSRIVLATLIIALATGCANRQRRETDAEGEYSYVDEEFAGEYGYDPIANPNGGGYVEDIPLNGRPDGVDFYDGSVNRNLFPPIYFGFDQYEVASAEFGKIRQVADYLRTNPDHLIMAGHTDEIGTAEYNRNLAERRALAVRSALVRLGVASERVHTVSYGEDYPAQTGNDDANRRAEFGFYR